MLAPERFGSAGQQADAGADGQHRALRQGREFLSEAFPFWLK